MPPTDADLLAQLARTAAALDSEAADLIDVEVDDDGRQRADVPARDRGYFEAVSEQAQALRELVDTIRERQRARRPVPSTKPAAATDHRTTQELLDGW